MIFSLQVIEDDQDKPNAMGINDKLTKSNMNRSQKSSFSAKHTKIPKDFACSMLSLSIFSRAILSRNLRWVRGPTLTRPLLHF